MEPNFSSLHDGEAWYYLEVPDIACCNSEADLQGSRRYQQIFERDGQTLGGLITLDSPGQLGCLDGDCVNGNITD